MSLWPSGWRLRVPVPECARGDTAWRGVNALAWMSNAGVVAGVTALPVPGDGGPAYAESVPIDALCFMWAPLLLMLLLLLLLLLQAVNGAAVAQQAVLLPRGDTCDSE